jgi:energy-coupling factor transporter transmembrane protein EcfT
METRGFGARVQKVSYEELKITPRDKTLTTAILTAIIIIILMLFYPYHTGFTL